MHTSEFAPDRGASAGNFRLYQFCRRLFIEGIRRTNGSGGKRLSHAPISGGRGCARATRFAATALLAMGTLTAVATLSANDAQAQSVALSKPNDTTLRLTYAGILETNGGASAGCSDDDPIPSDCVVFIETRIDLPSGTTVTRVDGRNASTPNYTLMLSAIEGINNTITTSNPNQIFITASREALDGTVGTNSDGSGIIDVAIATRNVASDTVIINHGQTRALNNSLGEVPGSVFAPGAVSGPPQTFSVVGAATVLVGQPMVSIVGEDAEIGTGGAATGGMASFIVRVENFDATDAAYTAINMQVPGLAENVSPVGFNTGQTFFTTSFTVTIDSSARAANNVTNATQPFFAAGSGSMGEFRLMLPSGLFTATNGTAGDIGDEDITINIATKAGATPSAMPVFMLDTPTFHTGLAGGGGPSAGRGSGDLPVAGDPADHITFTIFNSGRLESLTASGQTLTPAFDPKREALTYAVTLSAGTSVSLISESTFGEADIAVAIDAVASTNAGTPLTLAGAGCTTTQSTSTCVVNGIDDGDRAVVTITVSDVPNSPDLTYTLTISHDLPTTTSRLNTLVVEDQSTTVRSLLLVDGTATTTFNTDDTDYSVVLPYSATDQPATITTTLVSTNPRAAVLYCSTSEVEVGPTSGAITGIGPDEDPTISIYVTAETVVGSTTCDNAVGFLEADDDLNVDTAAGNITRYTLAIDVAPEPTGEGVLGVADADLNYPSALAGGGTFDTGNILINLDDIPERVYNGSRIVDLTHVELILELTVTNDDGSTPLDPDLDTAGVGLGSRQTDDAIFTITSPSTDSTFQVPGTAAATTLRLRVPVTGFTFTNGVSTDNDTVILNVETRSGRAQTQTGTLNFAVANAAINYHVAGETTLAPTGSQASPPVFTNPNGPAVFTIAPDDVPMFEAAPDGGMTVFTLNNSIGTNDRYELSKITGTTNRNTPITYTLADEADLPAGITFNGGPISDGSAPTLEGTPSELVDMPQSFTLNAIDMDGDRAPGVTFTIQVTTGPPETVAVTIPSTTTDHAVGPPATGSISETGGSVDIMVRLNNPLRAEDIPSGNSITIGYTITGGGGATQSTSGDGSVGDPYMPLGADYTVQCGPDADNLGDCTSPFTFEMNQQRKLVRVTALSDRAVDADETIILALADADITLTNTNTLVVPNDAGAIITITDDDAAGVILSKTSLTVVEGPTGMGSDSYTVRLDSQPTGDVVIGITVSGNSDVTVNPATLTFNSTNWEALQTVNVTATEGATHTTHATITHAITTVDPVYIAYNTNTGISPVTVTVTDNDPSSVSVSTNMDQISESREEEATITISLNRPVTHDTDVTGPIAIPFTIAIAPDDDQPGSVADGNDFTVDYSGAPGCVCILTTVNPAAITLAGGMLNFATGDQTHTIKITAVMDEDEDEGDQDITFHLDTETGTGGSAQGVAFGPTDMAVITIREIATEAEVVKTEVETVTTIIGATQVGTISGLIRTRITSPVSVSPPVTRSPSSPDTASALHLPDNPQDMGDMLNGLGLEHSANADGGGVYAVWARGTYTSMEGDPTVDGMKVDYDGDSTGLGIGAEKVTSKYVAGVAVNWLTTDLDLKSEENEGLSKYEESLVMIAPYLALRRGNGRSFWISAGYGFGEADGTTAEDSLTASADVNVSFLNAGADFVITMNEYGELVGSLSALGVRKTVDAFAFEGVDPISQTSLTTFRGQGEVTYYRNIGAAGGRVRPYIGLATLHDAGDKLNDDSHALDLRGGGEFRGEKINASLEISTELLREDHKSWSISGSARYLFSPDELGMSLTLDGAHATDSNMGLEGGYGMMVREVHKDALLTPFAGLKHGSGGNGEFSSGMRLAIGSDMDADLRAARAFGNDEDTLKLNLRQAF